jgi:phosphoglycerate dehydrogenase-like enzyme
VRVHLENYSSKPRVFWLTPELVRTARRAHPDVARRVRFSVGEDLADLDRKLREATVLVTSTDVIRDPRFPRTGLRAHAPRLAHIHIIGAGNEGLLPLDWLPDGVKLTNNSGVHVRKAREFQLMALLALNARLPAIVSYQRQARWEQIFTPSIEGKRLAIVGLGDMGRAALAAARTLRLRVTGVRRSLRPVAGVERIYPPEKLEVALKDADFLVIAAPLTPQSANLVGRKALSALRTGAGVINVGRAGVLDHEALCDFLRSGHLSGAILDVFSPEPLPPSSPLWSTPNLIVNPHVSSDDAERYMHETMELVFRNVRRLLARRPLANVVDAARGY